MARAFARQTQTDAAAAGAPTSLTLSNGTGEMT